RKAIAMAAFFNLTGALLGGAVASTIGKGLVDTNVVTMSTILCAVIAAFVWNITTWWFGLPSSSSHALIGGLCGAALARAFGNWHVLIWSQPANPWWQGKGLLWKIVIPMVSSPIIGFTLGFALMGTLLAVISTLNAHVGMPVSTTHSISTAIMGVGTAKSSKALRWTVVERIVWAWLLTLPATALMGFAIVELAMGMGWIG